MKKCPRCLNLFTFRKKIQLSDAIICRQCFRELGFDKGYDIISHLYSYDDIKDGVDEMYRRKHEEAKKKKQSSLSGSNEFFGVRIAGAGHKQKLNAVPEEWQIYDEVYKIFKRLGGNVEDLKFNRYTKNYVTAKYHDESDLARFHWGPRSKWILFPCAEVSTEKHYIESVEDVRQFEDLIADTVENFNEWY